MTQKALGAYVNISTEFIQTDAHALINAHPFHHESLGSQKWVETMIFLSKMHGSMTNWSYISNYSVLWLCYWGQILSTSICTNLVFAHTQWATIWMNMVIKSGIIWCSLVGWIQQYLISPNKHTRCEDRQWALEPVWFQWNPCHKPSMFHSDRLTSFLVMNDQM